jgi:outer membrane biosynthesis protein TonB
VALSDEQQAMLRLLAQGEQGYGDIAALLGLSEAEVRAKVVGALAQLEAEGKPAPDVPPPVPGGAKPAAEVAPEPEPVDDEPEAEPDEEPAVAEAVAPKPKAAVKPKPAPAKAAAPAPDRPPAAGKTITLPTGRNAWFLGGGIVAAIVVIVVVIILVSSGGSDKNSSTSPVAETPPAETEGTTEEGATENTAAQTPTQAKLTAVDGSAAKGTATFGRVEVENKEGEKEGKLALQVEASGLEPSEKEDTYTVWIAESPRKMLPIVYGIEVEPKGKGAEKIAAQFELPVEVLAYLAAGTFDEIAITRTNNEELKESVEAATKAKETPKYVGEPVLRGTISGPIIGLAKREEEAKKEEKGE